MMHTKRNVPFAYTTGHQQVTLAIQVSHTTQVGKHLLLRAQSTRV